MSAGWLNPLNTLTCENLRELGYTGEQHELQMLVGFLEYGIESFEDFTVLVFQQTLFPLNGGGIAGIEYIEDGLVVFVDKHYGTTAKFLMCLFQYIRKPSANICKVRIFPIFRFPGSNGTFNDIF